ncbi:protein inscuteable homolog isoform X2 [Acanthaster planci]|nr:protein inscuteable homolog isoform X2 [Acanthaster planci]XP_022110021.1 protein inscuteable homolog isoform X2 [Acanthaster planci]XP_022110028.1 protein inscuteable homolog isoform X2 [Acanthaster planci]XP_022110040.1 protein inscuteable homolog isoform X2 [Acanthaster planci]XP_022110050.1 protein inscuteable homolog isoform X2 [Acanthaster planci]
MNGFNNSALASWLSDDVIEMHMTDEASVVRWLQDLRTLTECECMCILQGKPIRTSAHNMAKVTSSARDNIYILRQRASSISADFAKLYYKLDSGSWDQVHWLCLSLTIRLRTFLHECTSYVPAMPLHLFQQQQTVFEECGRLVKHAESFEELNGALPPALPTLNVLSSLGKAFNDLVHMVQGILVQTVVRSVRESASEYNIKIAINSIHCLSEDDSEMRRLLAKEGAIQALLLLCQQASLNAVKPMALKAVANLCNVAEGRQELERASGVEYLSEILSSPSATESVKAEAASVVAQITSPNIDNYHHLLGFIEYMEDLLKELTALAETASSSSVFVITVSAIANITFMDSMACDCLASFHTARALVKGCSNGMANTLYCKDQVATILANMAVTDQCRKEIIVSGGTELLVDFLHTRALVPTSSSKKMSPKGSRLSGGSSGSDQQLVMSSSCEKVHQKGAIALARLARDQDSAELILDLEAIPRLVELCCNRRERNDSEPVLVACLAALRKLHSLLGPSVFKSSDVDRLIKPRLIDSFMMCSATKESFV